MSKRVIAIALLLVLLCAVPVSAATHEVPDYDRLGSIAITMSYQGDPVPGGTLTLYRVADVGTDNGDYFFVYTEEYADCSIAVTELESAELPKELAQIAKDKKLQGTTQKIADDGTIVFTNLKIGLYLLVQEKAAPGFKKVNPFLVSVPFNDDGHYIYDVDTAPKNLPGPETTPTSPPDDPDLPQTGQTNWPIPVLTVAGLLLITGGFCLRAGRRKRSNES